MITIPELVAQALSSFLDVETRGRFGASHAALAELLPYAARLTLEFIGNSDALYHNIEHSMLVTPVGHPQFYWKHVAPQVQSAIRYLNVTSSGRQWIANLYSNVFRAEREVILSGPQMSSPR